MVTKNKTIPILTPVANFLSSHANSEELHPKTTIVSKLVEAGIKEKGKVIIFTEYRDTVDESC